MTAEPDGAQRKPTIADAGKAFASAFNGTGGPPLIVKAERDKKALHPIDVAGFAALFAGLVAWMWLGDWRWAVTGLAVMLVLLMLATTRK